ncbi:MAG: UTP--glucose-1-phosphate uridylyltransferase [Candidatus Lambdaproteobacteria bacterium]|nr:UTP--glucose-1-phosphate uridylyltransferase [Candidatus Lambdaproteobacteria bacterium]
MKGVILAAGYGTRFLPASKTIPKEMFPLIDTPAIDLIVREMLEAGIQDILIVTSRRKKALEDYFDREVELESTFTASGVEEKLRQIEPVEANLFFQRQRNMLGTGNALMLVEPFVGDSPFVVAYPDDVLVTGPSLSGQLIEVYRKTGHTVLACREIPEGDISRFGVVDTRMNDGVEVVRAMVEKPPKGTEPSRLVGFGRYLYTPDLFAALRRSHPKGPLTAEFTQTAAINYLAGKGLVVVKRFEGKLLDLGSPQGFLEAIVEYGLLRKEFREPFLKFLRGVVARQAPE